MITTIVAPVDFSEPSKRTAGYAASLAQRLDATLHLVHVLEVPALAKHPSLDDRAYQDARAELKALRATLPLPTSHVSIEVRLGPVAEGITQAAIDYGADLVIMATHGRSGLSHLLMGSVAERVIRTARCPVLVVRSCGRVYMHAPATAESTKVA
jgi:universal stress protein A